MRVYLMKRDYRALTQKGDLSDIEIRPLNDSESKLSAFHEYYKEFSIKIAPDQDLDNFYPRKAALKGIIVVTKFDLKNKMTLEPLRREDFIYFNKANRKLNFVKIIIKPTEERNLKLKQDACKEVIERESLVASSMLINNHKHNSQSYLEV